MADRYWVGGTASWDATAGTKWALTSGGTGGETVPTAADDVYFDAASGAVTVTVAAASVCKNLNFTGFTGTFAGTSTLAISGSLTLAATMTRTHTGATTFNGTSSHTITSNGIELNAAITFNSVGGSWQLTDNFVTGPTRTTILTNGILDLNSNTFTTGAFSSTNSNARAIVFGTGKFILTRNAIAVWNTSNITNLSISGTPVIDANYTGATGTRSFIFGALTETQAITLNVTAGTDIVTITGSVKNLNFTGFSGTFGNDARTVYGNFILSTGITLTAGTNATTFASTNLQTITTSGKTIDFPVVFDGVNGTWSFLDAFTQAAGKDFSFLNGTIKLKSLQTSVVGNFLTLGTLQKYLQSTVNGEQATLSQASGTVVASYLSIQEINATGGAVWTARTDLNAKDNGNNTGWQFIAVGLQQIFQPIFKAILSNIFAYK